MFLPSVPFVLLHDLEPTRCLGRILAVSGLLEESVKLEFILVGDLGVTGLGCMMGRVRVGGSSLMYLRACSKVACIG